MNLPDLSRMLRLVAPLAGVLASIVIGAVLGIELGILVMAGVVLLCVIFILWNSVQSLTGEHELSLEEALSLAAPTAEEEQKRAVLRTLKDLEYERSVGKISEEDYKELLVTYRARAKRLIQAVDEGNEHSRNQAERLVEKRLKALRKSESQVAGEPALATESEARARASESPSETSSEPGVRSSTRTQRCPECQTKNDTDARFCKGCGSALEEAS
jgi:hypothetical protein